MSQFLNIGVEDWWGFEALLYVLSRQSSITDLTFTSLVNPVKKLRAFQPISSPFPNLFEWILRNIIFSITMCIQFFGIFCAFPITGLISIACISDNEIVASAILLAFAKRCYYLDNEQ